MSQRYLQAHCQSPTSQRYNQSFVKWSEAEFVNTLKIKYAVNKELAKPTHRKIEMRSIHEHLKKINI
jgi:hypothetical protein